MNHNFRKKCTSMRLCQIYNMPHYTLLHVDAQNRDLETRQNWSISTHHTINSNQKEVLLTTALISSLSVTEMSQLLRVLIDHGSQISLTTEEAAQMLGLPRRRIRAEITGVGSNETRISKWKKSN
ncbi:hypothetical protein JTB14_018288 [Gonioctena quinquepunctata]|nr:hypothetical protein JTB14_018288 [Gonioctena quinquepunctata]